MKLHLNLSLRRALLAALAALSSLSYTASAGVVDERYDLQYYLDFSYNKGMFTAGATNLAVFYKDGTSIPNNVIPLMPNLNSYARVGTKTTLPGAGTILEGNGGAGLISSQFMFGAAHVYRKTDEPDTVFFNTENGSCSTSYDEVNQHLFGADSGIQRLSKLVTEVAYTPMADDAFMQSLKNNTTWLYRLGNGGTWSTTGESLDTHSNALGGIINATSYTNNGGDWCIQGWHRKGDGPYDTRTPLDMGVYFGDSGSPLYAWDAENERFLLVGSMFASNVAVGYDNYFKVQFYPSKAQELIDKYTVVADGFSGAETIVWGVQDTATGRGTLTQGEVAVEYTGKGTDNGLGDTLGLTFATQDTEHVQTLELQGSVDMGAGAMSFSSGSWRLTESAASHTFNSAGFDISEGAELTLELTATADEEWRKVGEGTMTIAGSGDNDAVLRVGGGTTQYNVSYDKDGNITGCALGNIGETRLNRTGGYAASSVRLEGGVAILVLMQDGQFKTNSVAGDTFSFGNAGGLLNLNGHDLSWGVINQDGSGKGARIGNYTPLGEQTSGLATFTYTGTGSFDGCFMDEGKDSTAQLAVKYNNAEGGTWTLTGNNSNVGGYIVEAGTMVLQGTNTPHVMMPDSADWTYASIVGSDVAVKSGATFQLSHHALMQGNVTVESGGSFELNQTVNSAFESVSGSLRQDMEKLGLTSLVGNVTLNGAATMVVSTDSPVATTMSGSIINNYNVQTPLPSNPNIMMPGTEFASFTKHGSGVFVIDGQLQVPLGTVEEGGLVVTDSTNFVSNYTKWTINEKGFLAVQGLDGQKAIECVHTNSSGVLALTSSQTNALDLSNHANLIIGAWGNVSYGTKDQTLSTVTDATYGEVWRLGGGTGTLTVNFKLTGEAVLLIGNEWSSGTVHLANSDNDFSGSILIQGFGNLLTYEDDALGNAKVSLPYGNAMALKQASQLGMISSDSGGILALETSDNLDLRGTTFSLGAVGEQIYRGELVVDEQYRFGGMGHLTLDTALDKSDTMEIDGQGNADSSVTLAREDAFAGSVTAGGGLHLSDVNSRGAIAIHVGHEKALASAASVELQKGAVLYTDGKSITVNNLTAQSGASIRHNGASASALLLNVDESVSTSIADGVLLAANNSAALSLVKTGKGTLSMGTNSTWNGGLTIKEGTVAAQLAVSSADTYYGSAGGIGAASNVIYIEESGTLSVRGVNQDGRNLAGTEIVQQVLGTGTIEFATGGSAFFSTQSKSFDGTVRLTGNTRIYLGSNLDYNGSGVGKNTLRSVQNATIEVTSGSQVRLTSSLYKNRSTHENIYADFVISGSGFTGKTGSSDISQLDRLTSGALAIDLASTVHGNITLADDATISSSSSGTLGAANTKTGYGFKNHLGGTVRGRILGEDKTLTIAGNESMTFTADSANTFGNLDIANGNGNNDDKFALRLNGGKAVSQTSTALGMGDVTLNAGLILRLAGTGVANNTDVVYTYANDITTGNNATIQSYNITNRLTGTVSMSGSTLNLATANGGVLELAGGIDGSGTLNVGAASVVSLGSAVAPLSAGSPQFSGSIVAGAGADITLASSSVLASSTTITGTEALTLRFGGAGDYALGRISGASALTLHFDFTNTPSADDDATWTTLNSSIAAGTTTIALDLNLFNELKQGNYTLISSAGTDTTYQLADTMNGRLNLVNDAGALVLAVGADNRLYWRTGGSGIWNTTDANWYSDAAAGSTTFSSNANVMLDATGVAAGNSSAARETISLSDKVEVGTLGAQESAYEVTGAGAITGTSLAVGNGGDLKLSNAGGSTFTEGVVVNDAALTVSSSALNADVEVENKATLALTDSAAMVGDLSVDDSAAVIRDSAVQGKITLSGTAQVQMESAKISDTLASSGGTLTLNEARLTGNLSNGEDVLNSTALTVLGGSVTSDATLRMDSLRLQDGSLQIKAAAHIGTLGIAAGKTVTLWNATAAAGADKVLGIAELGNNAILQTNDRDVVSAATTIGTVKLTGTTATVQDVHHSGGYAIHNIEGAADSTLVLAKNATSNNVAVFTLGSATETTDAGSQFAGTILLKQQNATSDGNRDVALILNHGTVAQKATINLASAQQSNPKVALGINVAEATIGGLDSGEALGNRAIVFSGNQAANSGWQTPGANASVNTLIISTAADTTHNFYGQVQNVNLVIDGEGTQKFLGSGDNFTGSLSIQGGTAVFNDSSFSMLNNASSLAVGSGTLDVSAIKFADAANAIRVDSGRSISFADKSTVAFSGMVADTEYGVFDISGGVLEGWTDLSASNFTIDGVRLSDMGRVVLNLGMTGGFSYTIEDGWDLVWNGGASKQVWNQNEANPVWQTTRPDDTTGELVETSVGYKNNDNVVFSSDADLELEGKIRVNNMTVADGVNLKTNGNLTITGALNVGSNVSWSFSGDTSLSFTETQLKGFAALEVGEGATLTMTNKETAQNNTSTAFNKVSGAGNVVLNLSADNGVGFNLNNISGDITVATGRLQVNTSRFNEASDIILSTSNSQLVFNGTGTELKNDVVLGASTTIHVNSGTPQNCSGTISGTISGSQFGLTKAGGGSLTLAGQTTLGSLLINGGSVTVSNGMTLDGTDRLQLEANTKLLLADGASITRTTEAASWIRGSMEVQENASATFTSIDDVHLSYDNGNNKGSIVLRENSRLAMDVDILSFYNGSSISMETKAELQLTKSKAHISNRGDANATITASSTGARSAQTYSMGNSNFAVSNAHFKSVATVNATLSNKLVNSSVENAGSGKLTVSHASNSITDVYASAGDMAVMQQAAGLNLDELVVASGKTVSAYTGTEATAAAEANVTVSKRAEFGAGAVLNANLTLAAGTTLEVGVGGLTMGSTLTLNQGLTLGDDTLSRVHGLSVGESATLFRGVDGLKLADTSYTTITTEDSMLASPWFTNLTGDQYVLTYTGTDNGSLSITMMSAAVPEPTTATLSLLALAALAARRRRK